MNIRGSQIEDWPNLPCDWRPDRDHVDVLRIELAVTESAVQQARGALTPDELTRADRLRWSEPRRRFIVTRCALRELLGRLLEIPPPEVPLTVRQNGKPCLQTGDSPANADQFVYAPSEISGQSTANDWEFSVSHSADVALIAISKGRLLGIDVEAMEPRDDGMRLAQRFFSLTESAALAGLPIELQQPGFYHVWTSKEAYLKGTGEGMAFSLHKFTVAADPRLPPELLIVEGRPEDSTRWQLQRVPMIGAFAAMLIADQRPWTMRVWNYQPKFA